MRLLLSLLFVAATGANAQPIREEFLAKLSEKLAPLQDLRQTEEPIVDPTRMAFDRYRKWRTIFLQEHEDQNRVMSGYVGLFRERYRKPVLSWGFAYTLTTALAGRKVAPQALNDLNTAIVETFDAAIQDRRPRQAQAQVRLRQLLLSIGVDARDAITVLSNLSQSATNARLQMREPLIKPIPPATAGTISRRV